MSNKLKAIAAAIVYESKLPKAAKKQTVRFIEGASDAQLKGLLLDGEIMTNIDEATEAIINERFKGHHLNEAGMVLGILGAITGVLPVWRALASVFSDAHKQCGLMKIAKDRDSCMAKARMNYAMKKVAALKKAAGSCGEHRNPDKCKKVLLAQVAKETAAAQKQKEKLQKFAMAGRAHGEEPAKMVATRT